MIYTVRDRIAELRITKVNSEQNHLVFKSDSYNICRTIQNNLFYTMGRISISGYYYESHTLAFW